MEVVGDEEYLTEFIEKGEDGKFTLNAYFPMPKELSGTTSPSSASDKPQPMVEGFDNWYDWRCKNWGTKWDVKEKGGTFLMKEGESVPVSSTTMEIDNGKIAVSYMTAWGPPEAAIREISKRNPALIFKLVFAEFGHGSAGTLLYHEGIPIAFEEGDPEEYAERYDFSCAY